MEEPVAQPLCSVCWDRVVEIQLDACGHTFCRDCIETWCRTGTESCPSCRATIQRHVVHFSRLSYAWRLILQAILLKFVGFLLFVVLYLVAQEAFYLTSHDLILALRRGVNGHRGPISFLTSFVAYSLALSVWHLVQIAHFIGSGKFLDISAHYRHMVDVCLPEGLDFKWSQSLEHCMLPDAQRASLWNASIYYHDGHVAYLRTTLCSQYVTRVMIASFTLVLLVAAYMYYKSGDRDVKYCYTELATRTT